MSYQPTVSAMQMKILTFIRAYVSGHGYPPTVREIGAHVGLRSTSSVHHQLRRLGDKGYVVRFEGRSRAISVRLPGEAA